jgi:hypothetical protein
MVPCAMDGFVPLGILVVQVKEIFNPYVAHTNPYVMNLTLFFGYFITIFSIYYVLHFII